MFRNHIKTAWRSIIRGKGYSFLNIAGLGTGMAVALVIGLWVHAQYSYDKFLPAYDRLFQVRRNFYGNGDTLNFGGSSLRLADALRKTIPEIEWVAETDGGGSHGLMVGDKKLYRQGMHVAADFLNLFEYPIQEGEGRSAALQDPYSIVVTDATAKALFGSENAVGKTIRYDNKNDLKVTAVLKDIPANATMQFDFLMPFTYLEATDDFVKQARTAGFGWTNFTTYVRLKPGVTYAQVAPKIRDLQKVDHDGSMAMSTNVILDPLTNWHLYDNFYNGKPVQGFIAYVRIFTVIGILVLLIACINFINLTTARSGKRAKEVGVKKAMGSGRGQLITQFLTESFLLTMFAFAFSLLLGWVALPFFNQLSSSDIHIPFGEPTFWLIAIALVLTTALIAGSRPAFFLSSFNLVQVLKSNRAINSGSSWPRKVLVVLQFSCSIGLIAGTFVIYQQVQYAQNRDAGYNRKGIVMTEMNDDLKRNYTAIKNELKQKGFADLITTASNKITTTGNHRDVDGWPGKRPGESVNMGYVHVSADYFTTLGMQLKEGRDFLQDGDTLNIILNESAVQLLRLSSPVNQMITYLDTRLKIIGVVKDAIMASPFKPADPTIFMYEARPQDVMLYKLGTSVPVQRAIASLTEVFNQYNPAYPFTYEFADDSYAAKFRLEILIGKLSAIFAGLAVFISCLGLFGLSAYMAEQRTREIGIRKVLGASVPQVWLLLSKDFMVLVMIGCMIAGPLSYYVLGNWLQQYDYRINIHPLVFIIAGLLALGIAIITISFQAIRAAVANPVKSLRTE